jgi:signal transduction histidine kinase
MTKAARKETDESLSKERHASDATDQLKSVEVDADRVVELARTRADAILIHAREQEDQDPQESGSSDEIAGDRDDADEILQDERSTADEILRRERQDSARVISQVLPLSRRSTDWKLLTERASADDALVRRDDFLGMVSHDLNNLLLAIVLSANSAASYASKTPEGARVSLKMSRIELYAARMKRLIGDLTDVTSLAAGHLAVTTAPQDVEALVAEALATFRLLAAEKQISLKAEVADAPLIVACDGGRILQVLANIVGNAIKFTSDGGRVSASVALRGKDVHFSVTDTGPGIPENLLEDVFEQFWQAGKEKRRGLGLGLYIAKGIIEAHGGRIWAESRLGEGSCFHFTIPARRAPASLSRP